MDGYTLRQFYGPSPRHPRACVEAGFPLVGERFRLAPFDAVLVAHGIRPGEPLSDDPVPLEEAVRHLARAMLTSQAPWWSAHGTEGARGWAALAHPFPRAAGFALEAALGMLTGTGPLHPALAARLRKLSKWLAATMKTKMRIQASADMLGLGSVNVHLAADVYQVGQGARGVHFNQAGTQHDGLTGLILEREKHYTADVLHLMGLPAPRGVLVSDASEVPEAIARVGLPCVVKPLALSQGQGVSTNLTSEAQATAAVAYALELSGKRVRIENHVEGQDYRLLVSGDELLWAFNRTPAAVVGDGESSIGELVERENRRRAAIRSGTDAYLVPIDSGAAFERLLADRYGLEPASVLESGRRITVCAQANISRGATLGDVLGVVHPDNRALAIRVSRLFRVRTMGVDLIIPDISRSWKEGNCAIVEVNRTPGTRGIGDSTVLLRTLFPNRLSGRVPCIVAIGPAPFRAHAAAAVGAACAQAGLRLATADYGDEGSAPQARISATHTAPAVARALLDPEADAVLVRCTPEEVEHKGLPLGACDLLLVEDGPQFGWLSHAAETVIEGEPAPERVAEAVDALARRYRAPDGGGPRPVLEAAGAPAEESFRLSVWRARAMPRAWFWSEVGIEAPDRHGMATHTDLLAAVRALAAAALDDRAAAALPPAFSHGALIGSWFRTTFEATLALPPAHAPAARTALLAATERVNRICGMPIP